ncbi:phosphotransferase enzyme family protein [Vibrio nigripulchritudo]|uniref:phosphotransferase enzyme family protein n=1 Tax=Vibrio nigripulchritudo TaxID=28173 RepID=UPI00249026F2|nr:phosphotransferase [Vibrio nigripulchritudo]
MKELNGGRENSIFQCGDTVIRPLNPWSSTIHQLLTHLSQKGMSGIPKLVGKDESNEHLTFVEGDTFNYPLRGAIASEEALVSAAQLLRKMHDASESFVHEHSVEELCWMQTPRKPYEVICHNDFAPYNVALVGNETVGVFDFDTAHPAPRIWDLAYAVYCWSPFKTHPSDRLGNLQDQIDRARLFCEGYSISVEEREQLPSVMISRLETLVAFMHKEASLDNESFVSNIRDGHHHAYMKDIEYIRKNQKAIRMGLG